MNVSAALAISLALTTAAAAQEVLASIEGSYYDFLSADCRADLDGDGRPDLVAGVATGWCGFKFYYAHGSVRTYSSATAAQLLDVSPSSCGDWFGNAVLTLDDLDGDGIADLLAAANGPIGGQLQARSGATGALLYRLPVPLSYFGDVETWAQGHRTIDAVGDADGDGFSDFVLTTDTGTRVCSGRDGATVSEVVTGSYEFSTENSVAGLGDVDLDGVPDFAFGDVDPWGAATCRVLVCSARTGELLFESEGEPGPLGETSDGYGQCVAGPGDVNADGRADLLVGMWRDESIEQLGEVRVLSGNGGSLLFGMDLVPVAWSVNVSVSQLGDLDADGFADALLSFDGLQVDVWSGRDASKIMSYAPPVTVQGFGRHLGAAGDVDGDTRPDVIVGDMSRLLIVRGLPNVTPSVQPQPLLQLPGAPGERYGAALARLGDLDGDGREDLACGAPGWLGAVRLVSGLDGSTLATLAGGENLADFGAALAAAGDLDGDGFTDILVGAPLADSAGVDAGQVRLHSGATGALLWTAHGLAAGDRFGAALAAVGDADLDGLPDVLVGAPLTDAGGIDSGAAHLLDGGSGGVLQSWEGEALRDDFGLAVAGPGDVDGDGVPDVCIGAPRVDGPGGSENDGRVHLFSGANGDLLLAIEAPRDAIGFGWAVAARGDADGDAVPDLLVGAPGIALFGPPVGRAFLVSGATGSVLLIHELGLTSHMLGRAVGVGDLDGDGQLDHIVGAPGISAPKVLAFTGDDGDQLLQVQSPSTNDGFGSAVCAADVNGDGHVDVAASAPQANASAGRVEALSLVPQWTSIDGGVAGLQGVPGSAGVPQLTGHGSLVPGAPVSVELSSAAPRAAGRLLSGTAPAFVPFKGGVLVPQPLIEVPFITSPSGTASWATTWVEGLLSGNSLYLQAWIVDVAADQGVAASNGLKGHVP